MDEATKLLSCNDDLQAEADRCETCQAAIVVQDRQQGRAVQCGRCSSEYVPCACGRLLLRRGGSRRVACGGCSRVTRLRAACGSVRFAPAPGCLGCACGHCGFVFGLSAEQPFAQCPVCRRHSSVGAAARRRLLALLCLGFCSLAAALLLPAFTWRLAVTRLGALFVLYIALATVACACLIRIAQLRRMPVGIVLGGGAVA